MTSPRVEAGKAQLTAGVRPHDLGASPGQSLCRCLVGLAAESLWMLRWVTKQRQGSHAILAEIGPDKRVEARPLKSFFGESSVPGQEEAFVEGIVRTLMPSLSPSTE